MIDRMKRPTRYSIIGIAIVLALLIFVDHKDTAQADDDSLTTKPFASWGWSGTPVDQNSNQSGTATQSAIGFLHLNCDSAAGSCSPEAGGKSYPDVHMYLDPADTANYGNVKGWAWLGTTTASSDKAIGWMNFDPKPQPAIFSQDDPDKPGTQACGYPTPPCTDAHIDTENHEELYGWARLDTLACYGDEIINGTSTCGTASYGNNDWGWVQLRGTINDGTGHEFGLIYREGHLEGWAWSGGGTVPSSGFVNTVGFGWLQFFPNAVVVADSGYFSTEKGNVYAQEGIENPNEVPATDDNATFLLLGSNNANFVNFTTELGQDGTLGDYSELNIPDESNGYKNELGRLDFEKLETDTGDGKNVYGDSLDTLSSLAELGSEYTMNGQVLVLGSANNPGTFSLDQAVTFKNATASPSTGANYNGAGVIIVYGDLNINANTFYESSQIQDVQNLASVAWIVHGNVTIGENVASTAGAYFVLQHNGAAAGGRFITRPATNQQFILSGLVMAHDFDLQRTYQGTLGTPAPAELFRYDGRILINTPPGLRDYTSTLPHFGQ